MHDGRRRDGRIGRVRKLLTAAVVGAVALTGAAVGRPSTAAAPVTGWVASGPYETTVVSDGTQAAPRFTYLKANTVAPDYGPLRWRFGTVAEGAQTVTLPYSYEGFHAFFRVTTSVSAFVIRDGEEFVTPLVADGPVDCCTRPSSGFEYTGSFTFDLLDQDAYGFIVGGSNFDSNNTLQGTFTVGTGVAPYADPAIIAQNTSWPNALDLSSTLPPGTGAFTLTQPGEARWYKFPVVPNSQVQVDLSGLTANFDVALYRDIGQAFTTLTSAKDLYLLSAEFAADVYSPSIYSPSIYSPSIYSPSIYSPSIYSPSIYSPSIYSPSIYSPSIYSPSIYSPSIYSPSIYSPSIYSPSIYSPSIYSPSIYSPDVASPSTAFLEAFSSAQTRSLIGVSANESTLPESLRAPTWNNTGFYYVRVQGRNGAFSPDPFTLTRTTAGGPCADAVLDPRSGDPSPGGVPGSAQTVILTDTTAFGFPTTAERDAFTAKLQQLAGRTRGVVVDLAANPRVRSLQQQADSFAACPYGKTLVAEAIRDVVNSFRDANGTLKYVVLAGGDSVIPYFRYPDDAGLGPESDYEPPVRDDTASQASLRWNNVLGQDAFGALDSLSLKGGTLPVPDLAVGRLVETPAEIAGMIDAYLGLANGTLPPAQRSLVTGYDFLTSAADSVSADFVAGMAPGATHTRLITDQGVPTTTVTGPGGPSRSTSWTATDLKSALLSQRHDLVFLAGHFSANSALAADYATSFVTDELNAAPGVLTNALVFSAGCHSGYNLVDEHGIVGRTNPLDWAQAMARQRATFIGGTGYQYADTDFLAYSALLYAGFAKQLRAGTAGTPVAVGDALVKAKRQYLADHGTLTSLDRKSLLQAALFGLPMIGVDLPGRSAPVPTPAAVSTSPVLAGTPGTVLGLQTASVTVSTPTTPQSKPALDVNGNPIGLQLSWLQGTDGVHTAPAVPALPRQYVEATSASGDVLRGVAMLSADYVDTAGVTPLTGAPTIEQNNIHTSFTSPAFFPPRPWTVNYFGALDGAGSTGRTRLVVTPAQYRSDPNASTNTVRRYDGLGLQLFYSSNTATYGANTPALAAPPSITQVLGRIDPTGTSVAIEAYVTGDPSAGIQQAWVTYTGEAGPFHEKWRSIALTQDPNDSARWTATLALPAGQAAGDVRFVIQAVNGVGLVGVDNALGDGYTPVGGVRVDGTPDRAPDAGGWYRTPVTVSWLGTSTFAPFPAVAPATSTVVSTEGAEQVVTSPSICAGVGVCATGTVRLSIDRTPPAGTYIGRSPVANAAGWSNTAVTVSFSCTDNLSGLTQGTCGPVLLRNEGRNQAVTVTPTDAAGNQAAAVTAPAVSIDYTAPSVGLPTLDPMSVGTTAPLTVTAGDALSGLAGGEVFVGTDPGVGRARPLGATATTITGSVVAPTTPGVYTFGVRSRDAAGNWSPTSTAFLVVFDPAAGSVEGGGWFNTPAGSLVAKPTASGKTTVGFSVRYKRGLAIPVGETEFEVKVADFEFESTSYQWLVVSGARAQFRASGKVEKRAGTYDILVTVTDGRLDGTRVDRLRIKLTDSATGAVVYDTNPGAPDSAAPTVPMGGGNIIIR